MMDLSRGKRLRIHISGRKCGQNSKAANDVQMRLQSLFCIGTSFQTVLACSSLLIEKLIEVVKRTLIISFIEFSRYLNSLEASPFLRGSTGLCNTFFSPPGRDSKKSIPVLSFPHPFPHPKASLSFPPFTFLQYSSLDV